MVAIVVPAGAIDSAESLDPAFSEASPNGPMGEARLDSGKFSHPTPTGGKNSPACPYELTNAYIFQNTREISFDTSFDTWLGTPLANKT
jgi:hypothetical protein